MASLCEFCVHTKIAVSSAGSRFLLCRLSKTDPGYVKYPPQPVLRCPGFRGEADETPGVER